MIFSFLPFVSVMYLKSQKQIFTTTVGINEPQKQLILIKDEAFCSILPFGNDFLLSRLTRRWTGQMLQLSVTFKALCQGD